ncbi:MAG: hypothetical protein F4Z80_08220 [Chloroflexi bacterium]|nr:hypothetical protein [Chloroflexota bacterium]MYC48395.1 hypothetical protein [Chloroflexota bacterium]
MNASIGLAQSDRKVILRFAEPTIGALKNLVFRRYPNAEWATFARFGWRETDDSLVITLAALDPPSGHDLNNEVDHVSFDESYTLRIALHAEQHDLAVGVVHSHPEDILPRPSLIDDDMDGYFSQYFSDFAPDRPYVSLIFSLVEGQLTVSGRVYWRGDWISVSRVAAERAGIRCWAPNPKLSPPKLDRNRVSRLTSAFGIDAYKNLRSAWVSIVGAGGTGSAAIEVLARAGIGRLTIVDPDVITQSNLERVHGSEESHAANCVPKVIVARDMVHGIDSSIQVDAIQGRLPQSEVVDKLVNSTIALGCTDQQHSRLALSDIAFRYLVPSIDCGALLEGANGQVTGQIAQLVRFFADDPCVLCREMADPQRLAQELMSPEERKARINAAQRAQVSGENPDQYWRQERQLNTVGYLTTAIGSILAGYAIGLLTGRFEPPFKRLQMNLAAPLLDVTDNPQTKRVSCPCSAFAGWADQALADALINAPNHWGPAIDHSSQGDSSKA